MDVIRLLNSWFQIGKKALLVFCMMFLASGAIALTPLNEEKHINDSLISAAIGDLIRRNCSTISPRYFRVIGKANALKKYALDLGYTRTEIKAFLDDKDEKARVRTAAEAYLAKNGVVVGEEATYCALGLAEIELRSLTGYLLRAR